MTVKQAASIARKSPSTIRRWLKTGKLRGKLFQRVLPRAQLGSPRIWLVEKESLMKLLKG